MSQLILEKTQGQISDELKHFAAITDVARRLAESCRQCDSGVRSLKVSAGVDAALKALAERAALEKTALASITSSLSEVSKLDSLSSSLRDMTEANTSIKSIFESTYSMYSVLENQRRWQETMSNLDFSKQLAELTLKGYPSLMLPASVATLSKLLELQPYHLGAAIDAATSLQESLHLDFNKFAISYKKLFDFIGHRPSVVAEIEPIITQYPSLEVYREVELLKQITVPEDEQQYLDQTEISSVPSQRSLEDWLLDIDVNLPTLWRGACQALNTGNPDHARHVATSLRELFTHVVHSLAPDGGVRAWTTDAHFYDNGRPTRRARLLYINRTINIDVLSNFVDADVNSALTLVDALHVGTHGINSRLTDRQLRALVNRMELLLLFLFDLNSANDEES